jgi:hypothetical protein
MPFHKLLRKSEDAIEDTPAIARAEVTILPETALHKLAASILGLHHGYS